MTERLVMKMFQIFTLSLFILSLHQASYGITERDVRSFGENDEFIYSNNTNTEYDRLCIMSAHQNKMRNQLRQEAQSKQSAPLKTMLSNTSKPIEIIQQSKNLPLTEVITTQTPDSVCDLISFFNKFNTTK